MKTLEFEQMEQINGGGYCETLEMFLDNLDDFQGSINDLCTAYLRYC